MFTADLPTELTVTNVDLCCGKSIKRGTRSGKIYRRNELCATSSPMDASGRVSGIELLSQKGRHLNLIDTIHRSIFNGAFPYHYS